MLLRWILIWLDIYGTIGLTQLLLHRGNVVTKYDNWLINFELLHAFIFVVVILVSTSFTRHDLSWSCSTRISDSSMRASVLWTHMNWWSTIYVAFPALILLLKLLILLMILYALITFTWKSLNHIWIFSVSIISVLKLSSIILASTQTIVELSRACLPIV